MEPKFSSTSKSNKDYSKQAIREPLGKVHLHNFK